MLLQNNTNIKGEHMSKFPLLGVIGGVKTVSIEYKDGVEDKSGVYFQGVYITVVRKDGTQHTVCVSGGKDLELYVNGELAKHKCDGGLNADIFV